MPEKVAGAAISAGGTVLGAGIGAYSQGKAAKQQAEANAQALQWEKARYAQGQQDYNRRLAQWEQGRNALLSRYGIELPQSPAASAPMAEMPRMSGALTLGQLLQSTQGNILQRAKQANANLAGTLIEPDSFRIS